MLYTHHVNGCKLPFSPTRRVLFLAIWWYRAPRCCSCITPQMDRCEILCYIIWMLGVWWFCLSGLLLIFQFGRGKKYGKIFLCHFKQGISARTARPLFFALIDCETQLRNEQPCIDVGGRTDVCEKMVLFISTKAEILLKKCWKRWNCRMCCRSYIDK